MASNKRWMTLSIQERTNTFVQYLTRWNDPVWTSHSFDIGVANRQATLGVTNFILLWLLAYRQPVTPRRLRSFPFVCGGAKLPVSARLDRASDLASRAFLVLQRQCDIKPTCSKWVDGLSGGLWWRNSGTGILSVLFARDTFQHHALVALGLALQLTKSAAISVSTKQQSHSRFANGFRVAMIDRRS